LGAEVRQPKENNDMTTFRPEIYTLEGYPHRSVQSPDRILEHPYEGVATLYDNYLRALSLYPHNPCLGTRRYNADGTRGEYEFSTFKQVAEKAENLASGLVNLGIRAVRPSPFPIYPSINAATQFA
jgi:hypothetical protein